VLTPGGCHRYRIQTVENAKLASSVVPSEAVISL